MESLFGKLSFYLKTNLGLYKVDYTIQMMCSRSPSLSVCVSLSLSVSLFPPALKFTRFPLQLSLHGT